MTLARDDKRSDTKLSELRAALRVAAAQERAALAAHERASRAYADAEEAKASASSDLSASRAALRALEREVIAAALEVA